MIVNNKEYPDKIEYCGKTLLPIGVGKYPYDCIAKDKHPDAMIYKSDTGSWTLDKGEKIKGDNRG